MAGWHGRHRGMLLAMALALVLLGMGGWSFISIGPAARGAPTQPDADAFRAWPQRAMISADSSLPTAGGFAAAAAVVAALTVVGAVRGASRGGRTQVHAVLGTREYTKYAEASGRKFDGKATRSFIPGQRGYSSETVICKPKLPPIRMAYGRVTEPVLTVKTSDYYMEPFAKLNFSDVKEVGTYQVNPDSPSDFKQLTEIPSYVRPKTGLRLEKEKGFKRPAEDDEGHLAFANSNANLGAAVEKVAPSALGKDIIAERGALTILLSYLSEELTPYLMTKQLGGLPIDLVKVTRGPGGKGVVLDKLWNRKNLFAGVKFRGKWKRSEASMHGVFSPAWERLATGDSSTRCLMITGLSQIAGTRAGVFPTRYRFAEFELAGMKVLTRARFHAQSEGKHVELHTKNWYQAQEWNLLKTYYDLLLGGVGKTVMGLHRSGLLVEVHEVTIDDLIAKQPAVVAAAERRLGRLAKLLSQVSEIVKGASGDGPWVLQWQDGTLVLGAYKKDPVLETVEEDKLEMLA